MKDATRRDMIELMEKLKVCFFEKSVDADGLEELLTPLFEKVEHFPVPLLLKCPECGMRHVDRGEFATKVHHTHSCQCCGHCWRPAVVPTVGVQFLPGFKDEQ